MKVYSYTNKTNTTKVSFKQLTRSSNFIDQMTRSEIHFFSIKFEIRKRESPTSIFTLIILLVPPISKIVILKRKCYV